MTAAWLCMGRLCEWVCRSEGGANDEEEWSYIDAPKGGKGRKSLMKKLSVEQNGRTLGCDGVLERRVALLKVRTFRCA